MMMRGSLYLLFKMRTYHHNYPISCGHNCAVRENSVNMVSDNFSSKQLLLFTFVVCQRQTTVTAYFLSKQLLFFAFATLRCPQCF